MGAWIETNAVAVGSTVTYVAPYVGAWIETMWSCIIGRLLKVAPYVGAWIETDAECQLFPSRESHPTWVRGLKRKNNRINSCTIVSHPTWVRGLKHVLDDHVLRVHEVAPYVGAWIETLQRIPIAYA